MSFIFYFLAAVTIIGALGVVLSPNVVHSALFLVLSFVGVAAIYFYIGAEFLGAVQLMVYSGAVAVLIVMAIMLTRRDSMAQSNPSQKLFRRVVTGLLAGSIFFLIGCGIVLAPLPAGEFAASTGADGIAQLMLGTYLVPFEVTAVLLLAAMVGALLLARGGDAACSVFLICSFCLHCCSALGSMGSSRGAASSRFSCAWS